MDTKQEIIQLKQAFAALQSWIIRQDKSIVTRLDALDRKGGLRPAYGRANKTEKPIDALDRKGSLRPVYGRANKTEKSKIVVKDRVTNNLWKVRDPDGNKYTTNNLTAFFRDYFGNKAKFAVQGMTVRGAYKGWKLIERIKDGK